MGSHDRRKNAPRRTGFARRQVLGLIGGGLSSLAIAGRGLARTAERLDPVLLARAVERARAFGQIRSLIIARGGEVAFAEALRGPGLDRAVNIKSVSKSVVAALTGAALDRGIVKSVDQRLADLAPSLIPTDADPRVRELTVAQLVTMQAGLERTSGPNYGRWVESRNWVAFALSRPFIAEPGERMLYSTGSFHVLGAALVRATGKNLHALAREWLGEPLGIDIPPWKRDPQGFHLGGNDMVLSPRAMLAFGEMHRLGGQYRGRRVLSERWVAEAWTPRTFSPFSGDEYGYGWFIARIAGEMVYSARGYGGQMIYVVPSRELTVVVTSDPTQPARSDGYVGDLRNVLANEVIPAAS